MNAIKQYSIILFIIPFILVVVFGWFMDMLPKENIITKFLDMITEKDLEELLEKNGFKAKEAKTYQILRIVIALVVAIIVITKNSISLKTAILVVVVLAGIYKVFYLYLMYLDANRIKKLNQELPYLMKSLIYLFQQYTPYTAIKKAYEEVNTVYKYDLKILLKEIDENPVESDLPYDNFVNRYNGKIENLDQYLKMIHRIVMSSSTNEANKQLSNLNQTISKDVINARRAKNKEANDFVSLIGFLPVFLSAIMVVIMMIMSIQAF